MKKLILLLGLVVSAVAMERPQELVPITCTLNNEVFLHSYTEKSRCFLTVNIETGKIETFGDCSLTDKGLKLNGETIDPLLILAKSKLVFEENCR